MVRKKADSPYVHCLAGGLGGSVGVLVTSPLEVIKTRLQSTIYSYQASVSHLPAKAPRSVGGLSVVTLCSDMVRREGFRSMFKGLTPSLITVLPSKGLFFFAYEGLQKVLSKRLQREGPLVNWASGTLSSMINVLFMNPLFVLKTKMQLDERRCSGNKVFQCAKEIWAKERINGFFRGNSASLAGCLEPGIYFMIYEEMKKYNTVGNMFSLHLQQTSIIPASLQCIVASCTSKLISNTLFYPTEVVRTRLRQDDLDKQGRRKYNKFFKTLRTIWAEEGANGLYGGLKVHFIKTIPFTMITFLVYEGIVHAWSDHSASVEELEY